MLHEYRIGQDSGTADRTGAPRSAVLLGEDVHAAESVTVEPGQTAAIPLDAQDIRDNAHLVVPDATLRLNGRSYLAQIGGDIASDAGGIVEAIHDPSIETVAVPITNQSHAPLEVTGRVGRLLNVRAFAHGEEMHELLEEGKVAVDGDEDSWWLHRDTNGRTVGIGMVLEPQELWVPPKDTPLAVQRTGHGTFREEFSSYLEPVIDGLPRLRIGQTQSKLHIDPGVMGYIEPTVDTSTAPGVRVANADHANALGLFGSDNWHIRTETVTTPTERVTPPDKLAPKAIVVRFADVIGTQRI